MPHIITEPCIGTKDASCVDVCPVECIYEAEDQFYIHPEECIDCGACIPACPVSAIYTEEDVPPSGSRSSRRTTSSRGSSSALLALSRRPVVAATCRARGPSTVGAAGQAVQYVT